MKNILQVLFGICYFLWWNPLLHGQNDSLKLHLERDLLDYNDLSSPTENAQTDVMTASRSSKKVEELPVTFYIVTGEEIRLNGYVTLVDVLKSVPGMKVSQPGSAEDGETFLMRGLLGNSYTKILINNIPIQPSVVAGMNLGAQLPIRQAERVEIIYGPGSAVYGADAAAGVINIVTKLAENSIYTQADAALGDNGYTLLNFMVAGKAGKNKNVLQYSFYGSRQSRRDINISHDSNVFFPGNWIGIINEEVTTQLLKDTLAFYQGTAQEPQMGELPQQSHHVGLQFRFRNWEFTYHDMYRQDHASLGRTTYLFSYAYPQVFWGDNIKRGTLSFQKSWQKVALNSSISYLRYRMNKSSSLSTNYYNGTNDGIAYMYSASDDIFTEHVISFQPKERLELVGGVTFRASGNLPRTNDLPNPFNSDNYSFFGEALPPLQPLYGLFGYNPIKYVNLGTFVQMYYSIGKFNFIAGARFDRDVELKTSGEAIVGDLGELLLSGVNLTPRLSALYKISDNASVYGSFGTSYRSPSPTLSFSSIAFPATTERDSILYAVVPNPALEPEVFSATELGIRYKLSEKVDLNISGYFNQIEDLITRTITVIDPALYPRASSGSDYLARISDNAQGLKSTLWGVQSTLKLKQLVPSIRLQTELNITYAKGKETLPQSGLQLRDFRMMPRFSGQLNLSFYPWRNIYIRLENVLMTGWQSRFFPSPALAVLFDNIPSVDELIEDDRLRVDGYYNLDILARLMINTNFQGFIKVKNVFNTDYGGIGATGLDVDLPYNPQMGTNFQIGMTYELK